MMISYLVRTIVRFLGEWSFAVFMSPSESGLAVGEEPLERGAGMLLGPGIAEEPPGVVIADGDAVDVEGELLAVEVGPEVSGLDGNAGGLGEEGDAVAVGLGEEVPLRPGPVVELD